jgi:hypothetical protein
VAFKPCELRRFQSRWICDAAGVPLADLAIAGESIEDTCARCSIPDELARRPCLFMTAVKVRHHGEWKELFGCHWYHAIVHDWALRDTQQCLGCRDWFPRPPRYLDRRFIERTAAMRQKMSRRLEGAAASPSPVRPWTPPPRPWWRRVFEWASGVG